VLVLLSILWGGSVIGVVLSSMEWGFVMILCACNVECAFIHFVGQDFKRFYYMIFSNNDGVICFMENVL